MSRPRRTLTAAIWVLLVTSPCVIVWRHSRTDGVTLVGVLVMWLVFLLCATVYLTLALRPVDSAEEIQKQIGSLTVRPRRLGVIISFVLPGLWTGLIADSPALVSLMALFVLEVSRSLNRRISPELPFAPIDREDRFESGVFKAAIFLSAVVLGKALRLLR